MDSRQVFRDSDVRKEFLDRFQELTEAGAIAAPGGLEGLDVIPGVDDRSTSSRA